MPSPLLKKPESGSQARSPTATTRGSALGGHRGPGARGGRGARGPPWEVGSAGKGEEPGGRTSTAKERRARPARSVPTR